MHLMLRVALFLRDECSLSYNLIPSDVTILLILASHIGDRGFWYISRPEIARECRLQITQFTRRAKKLETQKLITIQRTGKANAYGITLPQIEGKQWGSDRYSSTHQVVDKSLSKKEDEYLGTYQIGTTVPNRCVPEYPHKQTISKLKKTERAQKARSALSLTWLPNEKNMDLVREVASKVRKTTDQLIVKFRNLQLSKDATSAYWDGEFENFLINEKVPEWLPTQSKTNQEIKSTVQFFDESHPHYVKRKRKVETEEIKIPENIPSPREVVELMRKKYGYSKQGELENADSSRDRDGSEISKAN